MSYDPLPQDLSILNTIPDLDGVLEGVAERVHDAWSRGRLDDGWTYGEKVDREAKTHPALVPYDRLSEEDRELDRRTSRAVIGAILDLGYRISKS